MRKFFAVIFAIILAFLVATGFIFHKQGASYSDLSVNSIKQSWITFLENYQKEKPDTTPEITDNTPVQPQEPENLSYDERIAKGDYYMERGFLTFAANEYVKAANLEPNNVEPYFKLFKANYDLGDYKKAQNNAEAILKKEPSNFEAKLYLALTYIKQNDFTSASGLLDQLSNSGNTDARVSYYRGLLQIVGNDYEGAKKSLKQAKVESKDPELDKKIAVFLDSYTEYEFAQAADELYLGELLARSFNKTGEYEMAIEKLKKILKTRSDLRDSWILFGFAYLNLEKYNFALSAFQRAYELDSEWPTTQYFLGLTYAELDNVNDAVIYLNYALANNFEPVIVIHRKLADLYMEQKDYAKAVEAYEKILEINKEDINSFVRPIWIYLDYLNQPDKALKIAEAALVTFPDSAMSYNLLGWSQFGTQDYANAEKNLKKSIELDPNLAAAYYNLGRLYNVKNNKADATSAFQKAYELDQNGSIGNLAAKEYNLLMTE